MQEMVKLHMYLYFTYNTYNMRKIANLLTLPVLKQISRILNGNFAL